MSYGRARALIDNLPPGSAYWRSVTGSWWTQTDHTLAHIADELALANIRLAGLRGEKALPAFKPFPRPESVESAPKPRNLRTIADAERFWSARYRRHRELAEEADSG